MLSLITALIASAAPVPPATAPLTTFQDDDRRRDELRAEARDVERMIKELHERLGWIEREMEELDGHHEEHHGEEHRERRVIVMDLGDEGRERQILIDGEHSELIERLVEELMEREERHEDHHDDHGDHEDHGDHDDHDGHHEDHHDDHHDGHHDGRDHEEHHEVRGFEFPGGHGEVHIRMEMEGEDEMEFDLGELLSEFGFGDHDLGGREIHMEVEIESEGDHGEEGEHHERHVERRIIHVGGNDRERGARRRARRLPSGGIIELEAVDQSDDLGGLIFEAGPIGIDVIELDGSEFIEFGDAPEPSRVVEPRERREERGARGGQQQRRRERAMEQRGRGMPPEAMQALRELQEEVRAMRREMNEMRQRFDRRD